MPQRRAQIERHYRIKPVEGFVEDDQRVAAGEGRGDGDALSHPGGTIADPSVEKRGDAQRILKSAQARADLVDISTSKRQNIACAKGVRKLIGWQGETEALRACEAICRQFLTVHAT